MKILENTLFKKKNEQIIKLKKIIQDMGLEKDKIIFQRDLYFKEIQKKDNKILNLNHRVSSITEDLKDTNEELKIYISTNTQLKENNSILKKENSLLIKNNKKLLKSNTLLKSDRDLIRKESKLKDKKIKELETHIQDLASDKYLKRKLPPTKPDKLQLGVKDGSRIGAIAKYVKQ